MGYKNQKSYYRNGPALTSRPIQQLLPKVLSQITQIYQDRGDIILAAWPEIVGQKLAPMTKAISFKEGILTVIVSNSPLYSLLTQIDRARIIKNLRDKFPSTKIKTIHFRMG